MDSENIVIVSIDQLIDEVSKDPGDARERFYRGVNFEHGIEQDLLNWLEIIIGIFKRQRMKL